MIIIIEVDRMVILVIIMIVINVREKMRIRK